MKVLQSAALAPVSDSGLDEYYRSFRSEALLTAQQEIELAQCYQSGLRAESLLHSGQLSEEACREAQRAAAAGAVALDRLVRCNQRLIFDIARRYVTASLPLLDLVQEGNEGLLRALRRFDPARGRLSTYGTYWIRRYVVDACTRAQSAVHLSDHAEGIRAKAEGAFQQLTQTLGREPSHDELAATLGRSPETLRQVLMPVRALSLERALADDEDGTSLEDRIADPASPDPAAGLERSESRAELREAVERSLRSLPDLERRVITALFGLDGRDPVPPTALAVRLGLSRDRVRQLQSAALSRLRRAASLQSYRARAVARQNPLARGARRHPSCPGGTEPSGATWADLIEGALAVCGGTAALEQIYAVLRGHPKTATNANWEAAVRTTLKRARVPGTSRASDARRFVGQGSGVWAAARAASLSTSESWKGLLTEALGLCGGSASVGRLYGILQGHPKTVGSRDWHATMRNALIRGRARGHFEYWGEGIWAVPGARPPIG